MPDIPVQTRRNKLMNFRPADAKRAPSNLNYMGSARDERPGSAVFFVDQCRDASTQAQILRYPDTGVRFIECVEVDTRSAARKKAFAQVGDDFDTELE